MEKQFRNKQFFWCWSKQFFRISLFSLYAAFILETGSSSAAPAVRLEDWRFYPEALQLELTLSSPSQPRYFYLSQPSRIVIDLPDTKLGYVPTQQNYSGTIQSIRISQFSADVTRIVIDLAPGTFLDPNQVQLQPVSWQNPTRWVLRPFTATNNASSAPGKFSPPPSGNLPPSQGFYNPPPPSGNLPPSQGFYNPPPPSGNLPSSQGFYNPPPPSGNLPPSQGFYNPPPPSGNLPPSQGFYNSPPSQNNLPTTTYNSNSSQPPLVTVPPITPNNPSQKPDSLLPPAIFPNQPGNINNNIPFFPSQNFPIPTNPNNQTNYPNSGTTIEFGQPLPYPTP